MVLESFFRLGKYIIVKARQEENNYGIKTGFGMITLFLYLSIKS